MTVSFPDGVSSQGAANLFYLPTITLLATPKVLVSEFSLTGAFDASGQIYGFNVNADQGTSTDVRYGSTKTTERPGRTNVTGDTLEYVYDPQAPTSATYAAYKTWKEGVIGYLVERRGLPINTAVAATQVVDVYKVQFGRQSRKSVDPTAEGDLFKVTQRYFILNAVDYLDVPVATS